MSDLERLERLEQSITQLLYEVDSNFSKCHRIITTNILPIVEKYAENSGQVWEHSKFWKQFFEASANVSLSGYEEQVDQDLGDATDIRREDSSFLDVTEARQTPRQQQQTQTQMGTGHSPYDLTGDDESSSIMAGSRMQTQTPLNRRMESLEISSSPGDPPTPQTQLRADAAAASDMETPNSSPLYRSAVVDRLDATATPMTAPRSKNKNHLLHRVLDSNWKLQATPHSVHGRHASKNVYHSTSPTSSPPEITTQLGNSTRHSRKNKTPNRSTGAYYDSDDDSSIGQMSPPVTMAFSLPPSKLLRTPAKEAARHMVDEILRTAGANDLSTIPSETPADPLDAKRPRGEQDTFMQGTQTQNESRRLFDTSKGGGEETPIARKGAGVLDNWQESGEGSNWL